MGTDDSTSHIYQKGLSVEQVVIHIITKEIAIQELLNELIEKNRLFKLSIGEIDKAKVMHALRQTELTVIETIVYDEIQEIEYYIEEHQKAKKKQQFNEIAQTDTEFIESEQNILSRMEGLFSG